MSAVSPRHTVAWFAGTLFASALLVFTVEPLVGRLLLPKFGGTSVVWNTCLVFFQLGLLAGYAYAHLVSSKLSLRAQVGVHLGLMGAAAIFLPISFSGDIPESSTSATWWLLGQLVTRVGLPFAVLSASAPLFQSWFSRTEHPDAHDPYHLYAASNAGSLVGLLAYPLVIEPSLALQTQTTVWTGGYVALVVLVAAVGWSTLRNRRPAEALAPIANHRAGAERGAGEPAAGRPWGRWLLYSALPSALLVSVTSYLTTDVASVPLLWVVPLMLYLATFILTFAKRQVVDREALIIAVPALLVPTAAVLIFDFAPPSIWVLLGPHLAAFFVIAMVYHGELVARRPAAGDSTAFYLAMSAGGVIGGGLVALVAPLVFDSMIEYPLLLALAAVLLPAVERRTPPVIATAAVAGAASLWLTYDIFAQVHAEHGLHGLAVVPTAVFGFALLWAYRRPRVFGVVFAILLCGAILAHQLFNPPLVEERSYFGRYKVTRKAADDGDLFVLYHGTTIHGFQSAQARLRDRPMGYYAPQSGIAQLLERRGRAQAPVQVGVVGLGIGGLAAYADVGELHYTFFEIDQAVVDIARDERFFSCLSDCGRDCEVVVGDGRMRLDDQPDDAFDVLVLDAYDSDSIPLHLLTREALETYLAKLRPGGVVAFHLTNRYFELPPVVGRLCDSLELSCVEYTHRFSSEAMPAGRSYSTWVFVSADAEAVGWLEDRPGAEALATDGPLWTDDFANVWGTLRPDALSGELIR